MNISFPPKITVQSHVLPFFSTSDYCPKSSFVVCQGYERKEYNNIRSQLQSRIDYARFKKDISKSPKKCRTTFIFSHEDYQIHIQTHKNAVVIKAVGHLGEGPGDNDRVAHCSIRQVRNLQNIEGRLESTLLKLSKHPRLTVALHLRSDPDPSGLIHNILFSLLVIWKIQE